MHQVRTFGLLSVFVDCSSQPGKTTAVLTAPTGTKPMVAAQLEESNALFASRDWAGAGEAFRQTIAVDPALVETHYSLALPPGRAGNQAEGKKRYIEAANLTPGNKVNWSSPPVQHQKGGPDYEIDRKSYSDPSTRGF